MATKNLSNEEAKKKLKEIAEAARICMMSTSLDERPIPSRPMSVQEVDEDGTIWFISSKSSDKNYDLKKDSKLQLAFLNQLNQEYLSVYGTAEIYTDQKTIDEHYSDMANAWFDGKDDPDVSIIGVKPLDAHYWDSENGILMNYALIAYSAITGKRVDDNVTGDLDL